MSTAKTDANTPGAQVRLVRGLQWFEVPGQNQEVKKLNWALMKIGRYPPRPWRVPEDLTGPALALMLEERAAGCGKRKAYRASERRPGE